MCRAFSYKMWDGFADSEPEPERARSIETVAELRVLAKEFGFTLNDVRAPEYKDWNYDDGSMPEIEKTCLCPFDLGRVAGILAGKAIEGMEVIKIYGR